MWVIFIMIFICHTSQLPVVIPAHATHRAARVLDHLLRLDQREVEDVPVDLLLDRVEVEVALLAERLDAVRVHDDRDVLVDEAQREHLPVDGAALVQEVDGVTTEVGRTAPQQAAGDHGRLARSPGAQHARRTVQVQGMDE